MVIGTECGRSDVLATVSVAQVAGVARGALTRKHFLHDRKMQIALQNQLDKPDKSTLSPAGVRVIWRFLVGIIGLTHDKTIGRVLTTKAPASDVKELERSKHNHIGDKCQDHGGFIAFWRNPDNPHHVAQGASSGIWGQ